MDFIANRPLTHYWNNDIPASTNNATPVTDSAFSEAPTSSFHLSRFRSSPYQQSARYRRQFALVIPATRDVESEHSAIVAAALQRQTARAREHLLLTLRLVVEGLVLEPGECAR